MFFYEGQLSTEELRVVMIRDVMLKDLLCYYDIFDIKNEMRNV